MAVHMKSIPTLRSQVESRFIAMFEDTFLRRVFHDSILEGRFYVEMWKRGLSPIPQEENCLRLEEIRSALAKAVTSNFESTFFSKGKSTDFGKVKSTPYLDKTKASITL